MSTGYVITIGLSIFVFYWICRFFLSCHPEYPEILLNETMKLFVVTLAIKLIFTTREKRPGYGVETLPMTIGCLGGGMKRLEVQVAKIMKDEKDVEGVWQNMQRTVLTKSETITKKFTSGIIQQS